jgi:Uma2 family endonuclease
MLKLSIADDGLELSRDDFSEADLADPHRYERAQGRLVVTPPPGYEHHSTTKPFQNFLGAYELAHPDIVEDVFRECWIAIDKDTDRMADIAVFLRTDKERPPFPERAPELVFEIVSPGYQNRKRDYEEKRQEYEQIGVLEYVIVDRFDEQVTVLRVVDEAFEETVLKASDNYTTPLLPGLEIPLQPIIG